MRSIKTTSIASPVEIIIASLVVLFFSAASASAISNTGSTTISSAVSEVISVSTSGTVNINVAPSASGAQTISGDSVQVATNDSAGYVLELNETTSSATTLTTGSNNIAASSGSRTSPVVMAANTWGYRVDSVGGFGAGPTSAVSSQPISSLTFAKVPASTPDTLATTASATNGTSLNVWYGVAANDTTIAGTYTNSVTYTAVAN
jgi:hypothetical protein